MNIKEITLNMFAAIDETAIYGKYYPWSVAIRESDSALKVVMYHDNGLLISNPLYVCPLAPGKLLLEAKEREAYDEMKALKELGNSYIREHNSGLTSEPK